MFKLICSTAMFSLAAMFGLAPVSSHANDCGMFGSTLLSTMRKSAECLAQDDWYRPVSENCKAISVEYNRRANVSYLANRTAATMRSVLIDKAKKGERLPELACYPEMALKNSDHVWDFEQVIAFEQIPAVFFLIKKNLPSDGELPADLAEYRIQNANPNRFKEGAEISLSGVLEPLEPSHARCEFRQKALVRITMKTSGRTFTEPLVCESML